MFRTAIESVPFMWILVLCLVAPVPLHAQVAGATLSGTITDGQGGVVPGAAVSITNIATGVMASTKTNEVGAYAVPNLNAGDYQVSASAPGFSTAVAKLTLTVGQKQELNLALKVGTLSEAVEVTAAAPLVDLTSSTISGNVDATTLRELPLNGRDWASLATLQPGVAFVRTHPLGTQASRGLGIHMTISGGRPTQNSYRLDGALVNDYSNAGPGSVLGQNLGVEPIQEFTVLTSNYSAEYGFTSGGVINAITRSGTNTLHGSVYEFVRNSAFDAADFFENANGVPKGTFRRNQFGASAGWKVLKDRFFVFGEYEGVRYVKGISTSNTTLSSAAHSSPCTSGLTAPCASISRYLGSPPVPVTTTASLDPIIHKFLAISP